MAPETIADLTTARTVIADLQAALARAECENTLLRQKLDVLCHKLFGKKSEGVSDAQLRLAFAQLAEDLKPRDEPTEMDTGERPGTQHRRPSKPTGRRPLPASLPRQRVEIDMPEADKRCACGMAKTRIGEAVSEKLDYVPASVRVIETVRPKYACPRCHDGVTEAVAPPQAVERSLATEGLLAYVVVSKYLDHLPLYRLERIFDREHLDLSRATLCGWVADVARALTPRMIELVQQLYQVERAGAEDAVDARRGRRQEHSVPILDAIRIERDALAAAILPKSPLGEAVRYLTNQWDALQRFTEDGRFRIDNNGAENQLRGVAIGRKNWLFAGSFEGARRAALLYSLVQSCTLIDVSPFDYLQDVLIRVATHPQRLIGQLTPMGWAATFGQRAAA